MVLNGLEELKDFIDEVDTKNKEFVWTELERDYAIELINLTSVESLFKDCSFSKIDLRGIDTSEVIDMSRMFYHCSNLKILNISDLNTEKVTNMSEMFYGCFMLEELSMDRICTYSVTNMDAMFQLCSNLKNLDISNFDLSNVNEDSYMWMFGGTDALESVKVPKSLSENNLSKMFLGNQDKVTIERVFSNMSPNNKKDGSFCTTSLF